MATEVRLFGGFEIRLADGAKVNLSSQKDRALLAILAVQPGVMHSRGKLTGLLWSERGDSQARDSLKHSLTRVRDCLGGSSQKAIISDRQSVAQDPSAVTVDVATFETLLRNGSDEEVWQASDLTGEISLKVSIFATRHSKIGCWWSAGGCASQSKKL